MKKYALTLMAACAVAFTACSNKNSTPLPTMNHDTETAEQSAESLDSVNAEQSSKAVSIESTTFRAMKPVKVEMSVAKGKKPDFVTFAKAFTEAWKKVNADESYIQTVELGLNDGWTKDWKDQHEAYTCLLDAPRGYLSMQSGADHGTDYQLCYWKRTDGKCLLGISRLVWQETDKTVPDDSQVAFYVYDPATGKCAYDKASVNAILTSIANVYKLLGPPTYNKNRQASIMYHLEMPRKGRDIDFHRVVLTPIGPNGVCLEMEDCKTIHFTNLIHWNGISFDAIDYMKQ
jgi:hypothetical protein